MDRIARDVVGARVKPDIKAALPLLAQTAGHKTVSSYVEGLILQAYQAAQAQQEPAVAGT
jgi:hypothetical protein